jgi:hypothetical protein
MSIPISRDIGSNPALRNIIIGVASLQQYDASTNTIPDEERQHRYLAPANKAGYPNSKILAAEQRIG